MKMYEIEKGRKKRKRKLQEKTDPCIIRPPTSIESSKQCLKKEVTVCWLSRLALTPTQNPWHRRQNVQNSFHYTQNQPHILVRLLSLFLARNTLEFLLSNWNEWLEYFLTARQAWAVRENDRLWERHPGRKLSVWVVPTRDGCVNRHH